MAQPRRGNREAREEAQRDRDGTTKRREEREEEKERDHAVDGDEVVNERASE